MKVIYEAKGFPILQNRVYNTREEAINCKRGDINVVINESGYIFNSDFDSEKMDYDQGYDNSVPSAYFEVYYSTIIDYLTDKYRLNSESLVLDIGCGKGTFLKQMLSDRNYQGKGIGIDPSYEGDTEPIKNQLIFVKEYFSEQHLNNIDNISLIILRHTLEHISNPTNFLNNIFSQIKKANFKNIPIFIEVPDVEWIFNNKAYWDFFYEHVNYFSKKSLYDTISNAGGIVNSLKNEFGDQYLWAEAIINGDNNTQMELLNIESIFSCDIDFNEEINKNLTRLNTFIPKESKLAIWGMASKGIIYSLHLANSNIIADYFVDINKNKQEKYIPIIGKKIINPDYLPKGQKLSIICMNPNYIEEIYNHCNSLNIEFQLFTTNFVLYNHNFMNDELKKFNEEKITLINGNANNNALQKAKNDFNVESNKAKYSYNFSWMGRPIIAYPQDMIAMQEIIWEVKPDLIIEAGIAHGGSLVYYSSILELIGGDGIVLGLDIDIRKHNRELIESHPMIKRIKMIEGDSTSDEVANQVYEFAKDKKRIMVCLDSNHTHDHVLKELELYAPLTSIGSYCVVFDTIVEDLPQDYMPGGRPWNPGNNPKTAVFEFLKKNKTFEIDKSIDNKILVSVAPDGYLKRVK